MTAEEISKLLKKTRLKKGVTLYRMEKDTGLSRTQIKNIEKGDYNYKRDTLLTYLDYLGLEMEFIDKLKKK